MYALQYRVGNNWKTKTFETLDRAQRFAQYQPCVTMIHRVTPNTEKLDIILLNPPAQWSSISQ